jgi:starvation-inducible DNA-binding protein
MNTENSPEFHVIASKLVKYQNNAIMMARVAHWNVRGPNYYEYHLMFERIYNELGELQDTQIEQLRALGHNPTFQELSGPGIDIPGYDAKTLADLVMDYLMGYQAVLTTAFEYSEEADDARMYGFGDYLQGALQTCLQVQYLLQASMGY